MENAESGDPEKMVPGRYSWKVLWDTGGIAGISSEASAYDIAKLPIPRLLMITGLIKD